MPRPKLRIIHKGLLLLLIPLTLQLVLFFQLLSLESKAEKLAAEIDILSARQALMSSLVGSFGDGVIRIFGKITGDTPGNIRDAASIQRMDKRLKEARKFLQPSKDPYDADLLELSDKIAKEEMAMLDDLDRLELTNAESNPFERLAAAGKIRGRWYRFATGIGKL